MEDGGYIVPEEQAEPIRQAIKNWIKCGACGVVLHDQSESLCEACRSTQGGGCYGDEPSTY